MADSGLFKVFCYFVLNQNRRQLLSLLLSLLLIWWFWLKYIYSNVNGSDFICQLKY